jgi:hypothetical protein
MSSFSAGRNTTTRPTCIASQRLVPEIATLPVLSHCADQCACSYMLGNVRLSLIRVMTCGEWVKLGHVPSVFSTCSLWCGDY